MWFGVGELFQEGGNFLGFSAEKWVCCKILEGKNSYFRIKHACLTVSFGEK